MSELPKLDKRNSEDLLKEVKYLANQYTPEWNFNENSSDFGVVFSKVFCKMMESTISKYNKTVYNYYLTFLNMLGTKLRPAAPASGMVVIETSGNKKGVYIEKGEGLFASADTETGMVIYETVNPVTAIDTKIKAIYSVNGSKDFISLLYEDDEKENKIEPFRVFDNVFRENLQKYEIYFEDKILFEMSETNIEFSFYNVMSAISQKALPEIFSDSSNVSWEYYDGKQWKNVDSVEKTDQGVRIKFKGSSAVTKVEDKESRFIRCKFKKIPEENLSLTSINYSAKSQKVNADSLFSNDTQLSETDFFPFEEEYTMYNRFSICCNEAFIKKGANIEISAQIQFVKIKSDMKMPNRNYKSIMGESDFADMQPDDIKIETVKWEYWNGLGWAKLNVEENGKEFFKATDENDVERSLKFICPDDIQEVPVGSTTGYFIRASISKMNQRFNFYSNYITPYIHDLKIKYEYKNKKHKFNSVIVNSDLSSKTVNLSEKGLTTLLKKNVCNFPAMYFCLTKPLVQGMIRIFVDIEEGIHRFNPPIKWEYLSKDHKGNLEWKHIDVMDSTDNFAHSETVTLIGKEDFEKAEIFGKSGYFIRIVNPNGKYSEITEISSRPMINDIKFNAVRIVQKDTKAPEYFYIQKSEENKICKLSSFNVSSVEVWVDENNKISTAEQEMLLKSRNNEVEVEYDEFGRIEKFWIKWKAVFNLVSCGINDRVYEVDFPKGQIRFGDGRNGKIPPEQYNESIKIKYSVCSGSKGNVEAGEVKDFVNSMPHIDKVYNSSPIMGGVDMETIDNAARRMFSQISGGNRIVSLSDFEEAICFNDRNIYKLKCLSHTDEEGNPCIGETSIAVLPRMFMQGYEKFQGIKSRIWNFIDEKAPATLSQSTRLKIFEVGYVETSVSVEVVINDFNFYQGVYSGIESRLKKFLNPVTGNFSGKGWPIGQFPRKEFIYNYIKVVPNIKWIKNINIFTKLVTKEGKRELDFELVKKKKFVVPVFGTPEINITIN